MSRPLIPKSMSKTKLLIYKNFSMWDFVFTVVFAIIAVICGWSLSICGIIFQVIIAILIFMALEAFLIPLTISTNERVYNKVISAFKFLASTKKYKYDPVSLESSTTQEGKEETKDQTQEKDVEMENN